jgi:PKD repeat protein
MVGTANVAEGGGGDASGVATTEYSVDGGEPVVSENAGGDDPFVTEFTVSGEGEHVVEYGSTDNAGNEEPTQSVEFEILGDGENAPPVIDSITADPDEGISPLEVDFSAAVSDPDGDELTYSWDFDGDGTEDSTEESPTHIYTLPGEYEAELTVSDGELEASDSVTVAVGDAGGEAELSLDAMPRRASVKVGKSKTFRARVGNVGDAAATGVKVCASTPTRKAAVRGRNCVRYANLAEAAKETARFEVKAKRKGAGKKVTVRFTAEAANADTQTARATLKIKRKR